MLTKNFCNFSFILLMTLMVFFVSCNQKSEKHLYPLDPEIKTLSEDLHSQAYKDVVNTMIYQDLIEEWKRVATADNYIVFRENHGGMEKIKADSLLSRAYEERRQIASDFLAFMEEAIRSKNRNPGFDLDQAEQLMLSEMKRSEALKDFEVLNIKPIMAARGAEKQWPGFRGPTGQGIARGKKFPQTWSTTENVAWKVTLTGRGNSSPVVWDNRIFITSASEDGKIRELYCYNRKNGDLLWKGAAPVPENIERLYWKNSYASSTPVTDGERVIVFFGNSGMVCFNMDGELQWTRDLGEFTTTHGPGTNPVLYKNKVILIQDQNRGESVFVALDKQTGEILWRKERESVMGWSSPILVHVDGHDELIYNGSHNVKGYNPDTGEEIWNVNGSTREAVPIIVSGGGLFYSVSGRNGTIMAIRPGGKGEITDTHKLWFNERGGPHVPSPVYYKERLYIITDTGVATCLNALNGKTVWRHRLDGRFSMSPVLIGDKIMVTNEMGLTTIFKAGDSFEALAQNDLEEETLSTPVLLDGKLYFRTAGHLYCIGK
jgi:outer membrane protein assembly factor BamB